MFRSEFLIYFDLDVLCKKSFMEKKLEDAYTFIPYIKMYARIFVRVRIQYLYKL